LKFYQKLGCVKEGGFSRDDLIKVASKSSRRLMRKFPGIANDSLEAHFLRYFYTKMPTHNIECVAVCVGGNT